DHGNPTLRQIDIRPAAEPDETETLPGHDLLALAQLADDAASDKPGDLDHGEIAAAVGGAVLRGDADRHPLIVDARLVETRIEELALAIGELPDLATDRDAVHMHVEDVEKDADPGHRGAAHLELGRRHGGSDRDDPAVGRAHHEAGAARRHAPGVAEEIGAP